MRRRLRFIGRAVSLFFRLFILRSLKVLFWPGQDHRGAFIPDPPVIRAAEHRQRVLVVMLVAAAALLTFGIGLLPRFGLASYHACIIVSVALWVAALVVKRWISGEVRSLIHDVKENEHALCPECGYCLKGLAAKHECPECGKPYDLVDVRRRWSLYLAKRAAGQIPMGG
jgi:hypothetical protein